MKKTIRNSLFTLVVISLAAFGIKWNQPAIDQRQPILEGPVVLAGEDLISPTHGVPQLTEKDLSKVIPVTVTFSLPTLRQGQTQKIEIRTSPKANLDIVTVWPNGSINNSQTRHAIADDKGYFSLEFKVSDSKYLGTYQTSVEVMVGDQKGQATAQFIAQKWTDKEAQKQSGVGVGNYVYPLLP